VISSIGTRAINVEPYQYYFVSGVLASMAGSSILTALGVVPAVSNLYWLLGAFLFLLAASYVLWSLGGWLDRLVRRADSMAGDKQSRSLLFDDISAEHSHEVGTRVILGAASCLAAIALLVIGQILS
jgi:hypothetical protein